jgi:hypothetical protein
MDRPSQKVKFSLSTPLRHIGGVEVWLHSFLTSELDGGEWLTSRPRPLYPRKRTPVPIGGWVGPTAALGVLENRNISCPYRDSIPGQSNP